MRSRMNYKMSDEFWKAPRKGGVLIALALLQRSQVVT